MENSKKLIVYYSYTGHTKTIAENIRPNSKVEKGMDIVFTEDYTENKLVTSVKDIDNWIDSL